MSRPSSPHKLKFLRAHVCLDSHQITMVSALALVCYSREGGSKGPGSARWDFDRAGQKKKTKKNVLLLRKSTALHLGGPPPPKGWQTVGVKEDCSEMAKTDSRASRSHSNAGSGCDSSGRRLLLPPHHPHHQTRLSFGLGCSSLGLKGSACAVTFGFRFVI